MAEPLRFGIIGCGVISGSHGKILHNLAQDGTGVLVAAADPDEGKRAAFTEKWGVPVHAELDELLARPDIDAVTVCSPSGLHGEHITRAARAGKHVLCEKPFDTRIERAEAAVAAAKEAGVVLAGVFQQRFTPGAMKVKRAVDAGAFGRIAFVHCETPWYRSQKYYDSGDWRGTWDLDGGVLSNQGPHMIDRLLWLGGDLDEVLSATCESRDRDIEAETLAVATIRLKNGALGTITGTTLAYEGLPQRVLICGTEGSAAFSGDELVYFKTREPWEEGAASEAVSGSGGGVSGTAADPTALPVSNHEANVRDFVAAVREGRDPYVTPEEGLRVVRTLNAIYEKAKVGPYAV